jgi:hypothetical protein
VQVWPEHWHATQVFLGMSTQWNAVGTMRGARVIGLRYEALATVERAARRQVPRELRMHRRRDWPVLLDQLRVIEAKAADIVNG